MYKVSTHTFIQGCRKYINSCGISFFSIIHEFIFLSRIVNIAIALFSLKDIDFERSIKKRKPRHAFAHYTGLWDRREIHECYNYI